MASNDPVTFVQDAIHRPSEPRHFMRLKPVDGLVQATVKGQEIARSNETIKLQEAGFDLYDPVYYFPESAIPDGVLEAANHSTHCPLKGDTEYYHVNLDGHQYPYAAFCYRYPNMEETEVLKNYIAFDQQQIQVWEYLPELG
jgi:uncharacterized protein (DUF427 family)